MVAVPFPTDVPELRRARLARALHGYRVRAEFTSVTAAARALGWSDQKVGRQERGATKPSAQDITTIAGAYRLSDQEQVDLLRLLATVDTHGWWHEFGGEQAGGPLLSYEDEAVRCRAWHRDVVPALLQTEMYVRAMLDRPLTTLTPEQVEQIVQVRMMRRLVLSRQPAPSYDAIIEEAVLRRPVGGAQVMADQLGALLELAERPNITIQVVPIADAGPLATVDEAFQLLAFADDPTVVVTDGLQHSLIEPDPAAVDLYTVAWDRVADAALTPEDSRGVLEKIRKEYR